MPASQSLGGSAVNQEQYILDYLLNPNYDFEQENTKAAENALYGGFGRARRGLMQNDEIRSRFAQAAPILDRRADRSQRAALQTQSERAALERDVENARQAMERQNAAISGQLVSQTQSEAHADREAIRRGQEAFLLLQEQGRIGALSQANNEAFQNQNREDEQAHASGENAAERAFRLQQNYVSRTAGQNSFTGPSAPTRPASPIESLSNPTNDFLNDYMRRFTQSSASQSWTPLPSWTPSPWKPGPGLNGSSGESYPAGQGSPTYSQDDLYNLQGGNDTYSPNDMNSLLGVDTQQGGPIGQTQGDYYDFSSPPASNGDLWGEYGYMYN